jgi:hypothetical protein
MKTILIILTFATSSVMAQTNYNTCMNPNNKKDSVKKQINLHLKRAKTFDRIGNALALSAIISSVATYYLSNGEGNGKAMIFVPLSIGAASMISFNLSGRQEIKAEELK